VRPSSEPVDLRPAHPNRKTLVKSRAKSDTKAASASSSSIAPVSSALIKALDYSLLAHSCGHAHCVSLRFAVRC